MPTGLRRLAGLLLLAVALTAARPARAELATPQPPREEAGDACGLPRLGGYAYVAYAAVREGTPSAFEVPSRGARTGEVLLLVTVVGRPVYLVLAGGQPSVWRIGLAPGVTLAGVAVWGASGQVLVGLPEGVPVRMFVRQGSVRKRPDGWAACPLVADGRPPSGPDPALVEIDRRIAALTGRGLDRTAFLQRARGTDRRARVLVGPPDLEAAALAAVPDDAAVARLLPRAAEPPPAAPKPWRIALRELAEAGVVRPATHADVTAWNAGWQARVDALRLPFDIGDSPLVYEYEAPRRAGTWYVAKPPPGGALPDAFVASGATFIVAPDVPKAALGDGSQRLFWLADFTCSSRSERACRPF